MMFQSRFVAALLALLIAIATGGFCSLIPSTPTRTIWITVLVSAAASFLLIYFTIEYLIFKELYSLNSNFEKLKKKEFRNKDIRSGFRLGPLKKLNSDIELFANLKQKEIEDLKKLEEYRREFIADVSHELKTPIFAAQGFIHTLLDGAMEEPELNEKFLQKAARSLDRLDELVQDLMVLSELETGSVKMKKEAIDLFLLAQDVTEQLENTASKKEIRLEISRNIEKPMVADVDPGRIHQVFQNLIENGIKYGNPGGWVRVQLFGLEDGQVEIAISDNGPGIPEEDQKRIFDRFYRVEKSRSKEKGGSGLGLAIVKRILEAHKSRIQLESKVGKGSTFTFRLSRKKG